VTEPETDGPGSPVRGAVRSAGHLNTALVAGVVGDHGSARVEVTVHGLTGAAVVEALAGVAAQVVGVAKQVEALRGEVEALRATAGGGCGGRCRPPARGRE